MATNKIYSDIDLTFRRKPGTGDLALVYDVQAVIRSVKNLLFTNFYERPFNSALGSSLNNLLFEPLSPLTASQIEDEVQRVLGNFEPRVQVDYVKAIAMVDDNAFNVTISVFIGNATEPTAINLLLKRSR